MSKSSIPVRALSEFAADPQEYCSRKGIVKSAASAAKGRQYHSSAVKVPLKIAAHSVFAFIVVIALLYYVLAY